MIVASLGETEGQQEKSRGVGIRDVRRLNGQRKRGGGGGPVFRPRSLPWVQAEAAELI